MPLFLCDKCDGMDNTALGHFWGQPAGEKHCSTCHDGKYAGRGEQQFGIEAVNHNKPSNFSYFGKHGGYKLNRSPNAPQSED